jgi:hypothetical protein
MNELQRYAYENPLARAPRGGDPSSLRYFTRIGRFSVGLTVNK